MPRRFPRYKRFLATGVLAGVVIALALTYLLPHTDQFYAPGAFVRFALTLVPAGAIVGGLIAIACDRPGEGRDDESRTEDDRTEDAGKQPDMVPAVDRDS